MEVPCFDIGGSLSDDEENVIDPETKKKKKNDDKRETTNEDLLKVCYQSDKFLMSIKNFILQLSRIECLIFSYSESGGKHG